MADSARDHTVARYRTIARDATAEIVEKRSRFRCTLQRVTNVDAARAVISECRSEYWDAGHHCSAFVIGADASLRRSNDDGEPAGTAGGPILQALVGADVSDVVAVVTRWFGGVLLGMGGLARAYGDAVRAALDHARVLTREQLTEVEVELPHADAGRIESVLRDQGVPFLNTSYAAAVTLRLGTTDPDGLIEQLAGLTAGSAQPQVRNTRWVDL